MLHASVVVIDEVATSEQDCVEAEFGQSVGEDGGITEPDSGGQLGGRQDGGSASVDHQDGVPVRVQHDPVDLGPPWRRLHCGLPDGNFGVQFHGRPRILPARNIGFPRVSGQMASRAVSRKKDWRIEVQAAATPDFLETQTNL
jgi:hypothetical protein